MIQREDRDGIAIVRLAHGKASAFDLELLEAFEATLEELARSEARALVLTGTGSIFSAGVDLFRVVNEGAGYVQRFFPLLARSMRTLYTFPRPVIAAANGHAIAGGCILVMASDYRIMAAGKGRIGVPELAVGVPFPAMILEIVRSAVAPQHLQQVVYSAQTFLPEEAVSKGIIDEVVDAGSLESRALEVARQFAAVDAEAFRMAKTQLRQPFIDRGEQMAYADVAALSIWSADQTHASIRHYLEKTVRKG